MDINISSKINKNFCAHKHGSAFQWYFKLKCMKMTKQKMLELNIKKKKSLK